MEEIIELKEKAKMLEDVRQKNKKVYKIWDIVVVVILAVLSDCNEWSEIEDFAYERKDFLKKYFAPDELLAFYGKYYEGQKFIKVMEAGAEEKLEGGMMSGNACSGWDGLKIYVTGNEERMVLTAHFDNLGKGASGAAVQCLNLMLGCEEAKGLNL